MLNICADCNPEEAVAIDGKPYATHCEICGLRK